MDSHPVDDVVLWDHIPNWNGPRCRSLCAKEMGKG